MASIALASLPPPHFVQTLDESVVLQSTGLLPFHHVPDPVLHPRMFRAQWGTSVGAVGDAIDRHFQEHQHDVFTITLPRTGEVVRVMWNGPPNIQWGSSAAVTSVTADFEETLAFES